MIDKEISCEIQSKLAPIYCKYKDYPKELVDALQYCIEAIKQKKKDESKV